MALFRSNWEQLTTDSWILETVSGYHLEFQSVPHQERWPREHELANEKAQVLAGEIEALIEKKAVGQVQQPEGSPMFPVPKGEGR